MAGTSDRSWRLDRPGIRGIDRYRRMIHLNFQRIRNLMVTAREFYPNRFLCIHVDPLQQV